MNEQLFCDCVPFVVVVNYFIFLVCFSLSRMKKKETKKSEKKYARETEKHTADDGDNFLTPRRSFFPLLKFILNSLYSHIIYIHKAYL